MPTILRPAAAELLARRAAELEAEWQDAIGSADEIQLVEGDLDVEGDWQPDGFVLVNGNLSVAGMLRTFDVDTLFVLGHVTASSVALGGRVMISRDLRARAWVYANASNDYDLTVGGTVSTKLFVEEGMASCARKFDCVVWRTMNVVLQLDPRIEYPRLSLADRTAARAAASGLSSAELEYLAEHAALEWD